MGRKKSRLSEQYVGPQILLALLIIGLLIATMYLVQRAYDSNRKIIQLNFVALLFGLMLEYKRISKKWTTVLWTMLAAFVLSFIAFAKGKTESTYIFEDHLETWPYYFLGAFVIIATAVQYASATKKISEGITLLMTMAINYWIIANDYWHSRFLLVKCLIVINILFTIFSVFNSLSYKSLGKGSRLVLSIWYSIITLVLSIDNFLKIYKYRDIEHLPTFSESVFVFFQFFLLGISSIYIVQNLTMIGAYLPGKNYIENIREVNDIHLNRFSEEQVYIVDSIIVIIIGFTGFILNYFFHFLPINFMIWAMILTTPILLFITHKELD